MPPAAAAAPGVADTRWACTIRRASVFVTVCPSDIVNATVAMRVVIGHCAVHAQGWLERYTSSYPIEPSYPPHSSLLLYPVLRSGLALETHRTSEAPATRNCGSCTACCIHLPIPAGEVGQGAKPAGMACLHLSRRGCAIYEQRPQLCANFGCVWHQDEIWPASWRPDQSGLLCLREQIQPDLPAALVTIQALTSNAPNAF